MNNAETCYFTWTACSPFSKAYSLYSNYVTLLFALIHGFEMDPLHIPWGSLVSFICMQIASRLA
jgi:hypothetical protein